MRTLRDRLPRLVQQQAPNRVFWLVLTGLISALIGFIESRFNGSDIHSLAGQYGNTGTNPTVVIRTWSPELRWLAWLEVAVDTLLFLPAYMLALAIWCRYFATHSLFVTNRFRPYLKLVMQCAGSWIGRLLVIGALADLIENSIMVGWLLDWPGVFSGGAMRVVRIAEICFPRCRCFLYFAASAGYSALYPGGVFPADRP